MKTIDSCVTLLKMFFERLPKDFDYANWRVPLQARKSVGGHRISVANYLDSNLEGSGTSRTP